MQPAPLHMDQPVWSLTRRRALDSLAEELLAAAAAVLASGAMLIVSGIQECCCHSDILVTPQLRQAPGHLNEELPHFQPCRGARRHGRCIGHG